MPALLATLPPDSSYGNNTWEIVACALAKIDGPKIEASRALLLTSSKGLEIHLARSQTLYEYPEQIVSHLITFCGDKNPSVLERAALVISGLKEKVFANPPQLSLFEKAGDATKGIPTVVLKLLGDEEAKVRLAAARAAAHVTPELTDKALSVTVAIAIEAAAKKEQLPSAWEVFRPVPEKAATALVALSNDENDKISEWAVKNLTPLPVREPIEFALKNGETTRIRITAATALGERHEKGFASAPALVEALKDKDSGVRYAAAKGLVQVASRGSDWHAAAIPALIEALPHKDEAVRIEASQLLLKTGPVAKDAIPALKKRLDDHGPRGGTKRPSHLSGSTRRKPPVPCPRSSRD